MNLLSASSSGGTQSPSILSNLIKTIARRFNNLFEPEEVEVTFRKQGNRVTYTYTKVNRKQVA